MVHTERPDWQSVMTYVTAIYKYFETWFHCLIRLASAEQSQPRGTSWAPSKTHCAPNTAEAPGHVTSSVLSNTKAELEPHCTQSATASSQRRNYVSSCSERAG